MIAPIPLLSSIGAWASQFLVRCRRYVRQAVNGAPRRRALTAKFQMSNDLLVFLRVAAAQITQQRTPLSDETQQAAARVMIVFVDFEMLGQMGDAGCENAYLHLRRAGVVVVGLKLLNYALLVGTGQNNPDY